MGIGPPSCLLCVTREGHAEDHAVAHLSGGPELHHARGRQLPNRVVYPVLVAGIALLGLATVIEGTPSRVWHAIIGGTLAFAALGLLHLAQPRALGFGDVR